MGTPRHNEVIYKRRRLAALVILLVVVALIIWGVVAMRGGSTDESENTAATAALGTTAVADTTEETQSGDAAGSSVDSTRSSAEPGESEEPRASETTSERPSGEASETAAPRDSCELSDLVITAGSNKPNYPAGEQPELFMTVTNPMEIDCEIDLEDNVLRFEVYNLSNNARVWSDVDCNPAVETGTRVFPAGEERYFQAIWSRTTSAPEQCSSRQAVPAGSYFLHTVIGDNPSQAHTFNLR